MFLMSKDSCESSTRGLWRADKQTLLQYMKSNGSREPWGTFFLACGVEITIGFKHSRQLIVLLVDGGVNHQVQWRERRPGGADGTPQSQTYINTTSSSTYSTAAERIPRGENGRGGCAEVLVKLSSPTGDQSIVKLSLTTFCSSTFPEVSGSWQGG